MIRNMKEIKPVDKKKDRNEQSVEIFSREDVLELKAVRF